MQKLNYLTDLKKDDSTNEDLCKAKAHLEALWAFINPYDKETVPKKSLVTFMGVLMAEITRLKEGEVAAALASKILDIWEENDIPIKCLAMQTKQSPIDTVQGDFEAI